MAGVLGREDNVRLIILALALLICRTVARPVAGEYTKPEPVVQQPAWPLGLVELIKSGPFVQAYWVNVDDYLPYSGDTAAGHSSART